MLTGQTVQFSASPSITNSLNVLTFTIPLEISTGISLGGGIFNLTIGAGGDVNFGSSKLTVGAESDITPRIVGGNLSDQIEFTDGSVSITQSSLEATAPFFIPKIMAGISAGIGPAYLSLPFSMYFTLPDDLGNGTRIEDVGVGISAGITIGVRF